MRTAALALLVLAAGCNERIPVTPMPPGATVTLKRHQVQVTPLGRDPDRRYPRGPGSLSSWNRDRYLHFFSTDSARFCDVAFLDATGRVVELAPLAPYSEVGITSKFEVRHALFLAPDAIKDDGLAEGDIVKFSADLAAGVVAPMPVIRVGDHEVHVETAHRLSERARGLMHRPRMSKDDGMLFLYPQAGERSFWMMNTIIPLDIAYFDAEGLLLNVARMKAAENPAEGGDLRAPSAGAARFVLEVNYGWFDARRLIDTDGKPVAPVRLVMPESVLRLADEAE